jgi:hypothetical protein
MNEILLLLLEKLRSCDPSLPGWRAPGTPNSHGASAPKAYAPTTPSTGGLRAPSGSPGPQVVPLDVIVQLPPLRWLWAIAATVALLLTVEILIFSRMEPNVTIAQQALPASHPDQTKLQQELENTQRQLATVSLQLSQLQWARDAVSAGQTFILNGRRWWRLPSATAEVASFQHPDDPTTFPAVALTPEPRLQ